MKTTMRTIGTTAAALLMTVTPALAAPRFEDNSGLLVWSFLGFCAVIVVAQILPAAMMIVGLAKGVATDMAGAKAQN